jgi:hypothetical protein
MVLAEAAAFRVISRWQRTARTMARLVSVIQAAVVRAVTAARQCRPQEAMAAYLAEAAAAAAQH